MTAKLAAAAPPSLAAGKASSRAAAAGPVPRQVPAAAMVAMASPTVSIMATSLHSFMGASKETLGGVPLVDVIQQVPSERWQPDSIAGAAADAAAVSAAPATRFGAFMEGVDLFDAAAFGLSPAEASAMDPQHRLLLEGAAQLLGPVGRGSDQELLSGMGVFVGISWTEYHALARAHGVPLGTYTAQGAVLSVACGR